MIYSENKNDLMNQIAFVRKELIDIGLKKGLSNPETIACSQKLDELIIQIQKVK